MGLQHATLLTYSSAIAFMHKLNYHCDPTNHFKVTKFLHGAKNLRPTKTKLQMTTLFLQILFQMTRCMTHLLAKKEEPTSVASKKEEVKTQIDAIVELDAKPSLERMPDNK